MIRPNGFLQMFSIPPTGGAGLHLDFHLDTHRLWEESDRGKQEAAKERSKTDGISSHKDSFGFTHTYENGRECEVYKSDPYPFDNGEQSNHARKSDD